MGFKRTLWLIRRTGISRLSGQYVPIMPIGIVEARSRNDAIRAAERGQFQWRIATVIHMDINQFCQPVPMSKAPMREWDFVLAMDEFRKAGVPDADLCAHYWRDWYRNAQMKNARAVWRGRWEERKFPGDPWTN